MHAENKRDICITFGDTVDKRILKNDRLSTIKNYREHVKR